MNTFQERAQEFTQVQDAYVPLSKWQSYEKQFYDMDKLYEFARWINRKAGPMFEIYFDRRRNLATVDEMRAGGDEGKMTYLVIRNPWNKKAEIIPKEHEREFLKIYRKFKDVESQIDSKKLDEAFEY